VKAVQWPALPGCGGGVLVGGDTGEWEPATAGHLVQPFGVGTVVGAAGDHGWHPVGS